MPGRRANLLEGRVRCVQEANGSFRRTLLDVVLAVHDEVLYGCGPPDDPGLLHFFRRALSRKTRRRMLVSSYAAILVWRLGFPVPFLRDEWQRKVEGRPTVGIVGGPKLPTVSLNN